MPLDLFAERRARPDAPKLALILGLSMQLPDWPEELLAPLAQRFDLLLPENRDLGLSPLAGPAIDPALAGLRLADAAADAGPPGASANDYSLDDMAGDLARLCDRENVQRLHLMGFSMGGMIAQRFALAWPERVASLTLISTSAEALAPPDPAMRDSLAELGWPASDEDAYVRQIQRDVTLFDSADWPADLDGAGDHARRLYRRSYRPAGCWRQLRAIQRDGDWCDRARRLRRPALWIHGTEDPCIPLAQGRRMADAIPGCRRLEIPGWGHDLPGPLMGRLADAILGQAEANP